MSTDHPVHVAALHLRHAPHRHYWLHLRIADGVQGRRDSRAQLAYAVPDAQPTHSLRRLQADCDERCDLEYRAALTTAAILVDRARMLDRRIAADEQTVEELLQLLDDATAAEAARVVVANATEAHLSSETVARRGRTMAAARLEPRRAELHAARARLKEDREARAEIQGQVETLWDGLTSRVAAIADYFERRASTQARAYLRRTPPKAGAEHPLITRHPITPPPWAAGPNPWSTAAVPSSSSERTPADV